MQINYRVGILGAGLGSRLKSHADAKPLAKLGDATLLELHLERFRKAGAPKIFCALRAELVTEKMRSGLPLSPELTYLFKDTDSSLHTLVELIRAAGPDEGPMLFSMADTVMLPQDFERFLSFCSALPEKECAVLLTPHVDDEKPLWTHVKSDGYVSSFGSDPAPFVTSGMYFLQPHAMRLALQLVEEGTHKMRNFLSSIAMRQLPIKSFVVNKTIDVDHPSDLEKAAVFLRGH